MEGDFRRTFAHEGSGLSLVPSFLDQDSANLEKMQFHYGMDCFSTNSNGSSLLPGFPTASSLNPAVFSYFSDELMGFHLKGINRTKYALTEKLQVPKTEPFEADYASGSCLETCNFDSGNQTDQNLKLCRPPVFSRLPELRSVENVPQQEEEKEREAAHVETDRNVVSATLKRLRSSSSLIDSGTLEAIFQKTPVLMNPRSCFFTNESPYPQTSSVIPQSVLARQRRKKISDRTRNLQNLMPWKKKMDMATMLQQAYKYINYLKAQVSALQLMPCESSLFIATSPFPVTMNLSRGGFRRLEQLNRQELLQVLVNSPVAQTILYSQECCVYSLEQAVSLKKILEKNKLLQQIPSIDSSSSSSSFKRH